jgi:hypothetical protein
VKWDEIGDLVEDAYRMIAPQRLVAELELGKEDGH